MKKGIILLIISLIFFSLAYAEEDFDAKSSAESLYSTAKQKTGSPESLMKNFVNPLLGNGTLYNIEGSQSFQATLVCPSSQRFLEILMQPQETGDTNFFVYYDTNFDGNFDGSYAFMGVSGICSDGFIKCDAGTWQNCKYYKVIFNGNSFSEEEISFNDLTSCFCINNACGNNLVWKNKKYILSTFGGVIVSALQSFNSHYAVTKTEVQDVVIRYYGQDTTKCSYSSSTVAGTTNPEIYFGNPYQMVSEAQSQMGTSEFTQLFTNLQENLSEKVCTIRRMIIPNRCGKETYQIYLSGGGRSYRLPACTTSHFQTSFYIKDLSKITRAVLSEVRFDDWLAIRVNGHFVYVGPKSGNTFRIEGGRVCYREDESGTCTAYGACELSTYWVRRPNIDLRPYLVEGTNTIESFVEVTGYGGSQVYIYIDTIQGNLECYDSHCKLIDFNPVEGCDIWEQISYSSAAQNCPSVSVFPQLCGESCVQLQMPIYSAKGGAYSTSINLNIPEYLWMDLSQIMVKWCTQTYGPYPCMDDDGWYRIYVNGNQVASGSYGDREDCGVAPNGGCWNTVNVPLTNFTRANDTITVQIGGAAHDVNAGCRVVYLYLLFNNPLSGCYIEDNYIEDNCVALRSDENCFLKDRVVNGVYVVKDGENTGFTPIVECKEICGLDYCYDDWVIEEHYLCKNKLPDLDFTRPQEVLSTVRYDANLLIFNDVRNENGTWVSYPDQQLSLTLEKGKGCSEVCKVKVTEELPEVGGAGPLTYTNVSLPKVIYDIRECQNNKCPYDPAKGEEVVQDCACLSEFYDALISLQAVRLAGQDITCSSGVKKTLPGW